MRLMLAATRAVLPERHPIRVIPTILGRRVVWAFALRAFQSEGDPVFPLRHVTIPLDRDPRAGTYPSQGHWCDYAIRTWAAQQRNSHNPFPQQKMVHVPPGTRVPPSL